MPALHMLKKLYKLKRHGKNATSDDAGGVASHGLTHWPLPPYRRAENLCADTGEEAGNFISPSAAAIIVRSEKSPWQWLKRVARQGRARKRKWWRPTQDERFMA